MILFYSHKSGAYACFSNFYKAKFVLDGITFAHSEQALMYFKSEDKEYRRKLLLETNPAKCKALGRKCKLRPDWDEVKYGIMVRILTEKFKQNADIRTILLYTGDMEIHESCDDPWWGGGPNYPAGKDLLGKALMEVRDTILKPWQKEREQKIIDLRKKLSDMFAEKRERRVVPGGRAPRYDEVYYSGKEYLDFLAETGADLNEEGNFREIPEEEFEAWKQNHE